MTPAVTSLGVGITVSESVTDDVIAVLSKLYSAISSRFVYDEF